jgi:hypothetical protein
MSGEALLAVESGEPPAVEEKVDPKLDKISEVFVNISVFAFLGLQMPQIWKNFTEPPEKMADLAWSGYVSGSLGNLLLCTYFASVGEWAQVRVQAIGAITNYFVAAQVYIAGYFPAPQFWTLATLITVGVLIPLLYALKCLSDKTFHTWVEGTTPIGFSGLLFAIAATFTEDSLTLLIIAVVGLAMGLICLSASRSNESLKGLTSTLGGWMATFLFMWMPTPQIVTMLKDGKKAAEAFSIGFCILATFGNGIGATRAYIIKNQIWFVGSTWGVLVGGWATAGVVSRENPGECPPLVFVAYTAFLVLYSGGIIWAVSYVSQQRVRKQLSFLLG